MPRQQRGKTFEDDFRESFNALPAVLCERLNDQEGRRRGVSAPCDFYVYSYPTLFFVELKSTRARRLEFGRISPNQWKGLAERSKIPGVIAGVLIEYQNMSEPRVKFYRIEQLVAMREAGKRSVSVLEGACILNGVRRRTRYRYDVEPWLMTVSGGG